LPITDHYHNQSNLAKTSIHIIDHQDRNSLQEAQLYFVEKPRDGLQCLWMSFIVHENPQNGQCTHSYQIIALTLNDLEHTSKSQILQKLYSVDSCNNAKYVLNLKCSNDL